LCTITIVHNIPLPPDQHRISGVVKWRCLHLHSHWDV